MTEPTYTLLRQCANRGIILRSADPRWEAAQTLIDSGCVRFDWSMRGGFAAIKATERGLAVLASC